MIHEHDGPCRAPNVPRTLDAILANASPETRDTIRVLGEILGEQPASALTPTSFAIQHLGVDAVHLASEKFTGPGTSLAILANLLRIEMERHATQVIVGSPGDGLPPTWAQLDLGPDDKVSVPGRLIAFFPAGTLASEPLCVLVDDRHWIRDFAVLSAATAKPVAASTPPITMAEMRVKMPRSSARRWATARHCDTARVPPR